MLVSLEIFSSRQQGFLYSVKEVLSLKICLALLTDTHFFLNAVSNNRCFVGRASRAENVATTSAVVFTLCNRVKLDLAVKAKPRFLVFHPSRKIFTSRANSFIFKPTVRNRARIRVSDQRVIKRVGITTIFGATATHRSRNTVKYFTRIHNLQPATCGFDFEKFVGTFCVRLFQFNAQKTVTNYFTR